MHLSFEWHLRSFVYFSSTCLARYIGVIGLLEAFKWLRHMLCAMGNSLLAWSF
ncbi:hypothetical protein KFK09_024298 [Dendrobium nobile]|uniref:Uncharacterized protein n=1 Tax=Dendrobium nobile TaxID=94219 RepID=A0A8T3ACN0_DENNO|nr:hypothetical protein KFK09_024298 [Dendrobium nobile]